MAWLLVTEQLSCLQGNGSRVGLMRGLAESSKTQAPPCYLLCHLQNVIGLRKAALSLGDSSLLDVYKAERKGA